MDLGLSEPQQMLKASVRDFLERETPLAHSRLMQSDPIGYLPKVWRDIADLGWTGIAFPQEFGGEDAGFLDLCLIVEEMGRALFQGPFFSTVVLAGLTILEGGSVRQKEKFLPAIVKGEHLATLAFSEANGRWDASAIENTIGDRVGSGFKLTGKKIFVQNAHIANTLVVVSRTKRVKVPEQGITVFLLPLDTAGVSQRSLLSLASDRQGSVEFKDALLSHEDVLGTIGGGWPLVEQALRRAAVAKCFEMLGSIERVLEITVEYVKNRVQFGRPVGSFQAVQHHCANMAVDVESARYISYQAAWKLGTGEPGVREVASAKAWVSNVAQRVCALAHQCHGAIGFTSEYDLQMFTRAVKAGEFLYGDPDFHREALASSMGVR